MRKFAMLVAAAATLSAVALAPTAASAGCYRLGLTGYHWYGFCVGPSFIYPHERVCRNGHCWYR
jgi:opacity protein-like surface antigen